MPTEPPRDSLLARLTLALEPDAAGQKCAVHHHLIVPVGWALILGRVRRGAFVVIRALVIIIRALGFPGRQRDLPRRGYVVLAFLSWGRDGGEEVVEVTESVQPIGVDDVHLGRVLVLVDWRGDVVVPENLHESFSRDARPGPSLRVPPRRSCPTQESLRRAPLGLAKPRPLSNSRLFPPIPGDVLPPHDVGVVLREIQRVRGGGRRQPLVQLVRAPRVLPSSRNARAVDLCVGIWRPLRASRI